MSGLRESLTQDVGDFPEGYHMTELGPLPKEWQVVRLGEVLHDFDERETRVSYQSYL
jgi:hypothetical protein